ncbi:hypothetical protein ACFFK0_23055 [Paenibacillus chartarius]|uniref:Uncharacterized protein n=1 Tax=Paenibacillus chartarius TaxID=747481 RepID=A0ABV6DRJ2_9BACL
MARTIVLRGTYNHLKGKIPVTAVSSFGFTPEVNLRGMDIAQCISYLLEEQFTIQFQSSDTTGYTVSLTDQAANPGTGPIVDLLEDRVGETVTVVTDAGAISGTLQILGTDVIQILEPSGSIAVVPIVQIQAVI